MGKARERTERDFPDDWLGLWIAADGRALLIERAADGSLCGTVAPAVDAPPFMRSDLPTSEVPMLRQPAAYVDDLDGRTRLQIEAGSPGLGPTYDVYFVCDSPVEDRRYALADDPVEQLAAGGFAGMGLYDDWDDDLGVPWAFPIATDFRRAPDEVADEMRRLLGHFTS